MKVVRNHVVRGYKETVVCCDRTACRREIKGEGIQIDNNPPREWREYCMDCGLAILRENPTLACRRFVAPPPEIEVTNAQAMHQSFHRNDAFFSALRRLFP